MSRNAAEWEAPPRNVPHTHYLNNQIYTSEEIFEEERDKIFGRVWKFVCHESELPENFDYVTTSVAGTPLVVVRGDDGQVRTFLNICSHRAAQVVREPSGNTQTFTCLFHLWTYDARGNCVSVTRGEGYEGFGCSKENLGLREIKTRVHLGLVFINLDDDCESFESHFGDAFEHVEAILETVPLEVFHYHSTTLETNWKNWVELNTEIYHEYLHYINRLTSLNEPSYHDREWIFYEGGHQVLQGPLYADYARIKGWRQRDGKPLPGLKVRESKNYNLWPDFLLVARATVFRIDSVTPLSPTRTLVEFRGLGIKGESAEDRAMRVADHNDFWGPFGRNIPEDNQASESQTASMASGLAPHSLIAREEGAKPQTEETLRHYYREWSRRMGWSPSRTDQLAAE